MPIDPVTSSALIGAGSSLAGTATNLLMSKRRREEQYAREDNAVQRRAADLEAAGLSKTLAAGSAAQAQTQQLPNTSGFSDAGKHLGNIPMAKANRNAANAAIAKVEAETKSIEYANIEAANRQQWLDSPSETAPVWPQGHPKEGQPMWTNREQQRQNWAQSQDSESNTMGFYNQYELPNQPGVLQSQTGQILMLNKAWSNMNDEQRREFLLAYGAKTLSDVASNLLGSAAGSIGQNIKRDPTITHIRGGK